jgi:hypothetical protein
LCYTIENYPLTLKNLNIDDNNIQLELIEKIKDMFAVNSSRSENLDDFKPKLTMKKKEENLISENFVRNSKDFVSLKPSLKNANKEIHENFMPKDLKTEFNIKSSSEFENDLLCPIDDLRFKKHHVLPFNLQN